MKLLLAVAACWLLVDERVVRALPRVRRRGRRAGRNDTQLLTAELTALGLSAGMSFSSALEAAADHLPGDGAAAVRRAVRNPAEREGGPVAGLFAMAERSRATGAPLLASIEGYAAGLRNEERAAAAAAARRLPVKLLFPLALLILPGFLLLTVGPAMLAGLNRLGL